MYWTSHRLTSGSGPQNYCWTSICRPPGSCSVAAPPPAEFSLQFRLFSPDSIIKLTQNSFCFPQFRRRTFLWLLWGIYDFRRSFWLLPGGPWLSELSGQRGSPGSSPGSPSDASSDRVAAATFHPLAEFCLVGCWKSNWAGWKSCSQSGCCSYCAKSCCSAYFWGGRARTRLFRWLVFGSGPCFGTGGSTDGNWTGSRLLKLFGGFSRRVFVT